MPDQDTLDRAREDAREGKAPSTQAGEFVREEMHHIREGKHGAASTKQAIAIGLSKARRAGVDLPEPGPEAGAKTRKKAGQDRARGSTRRKPSPKRSRATRKALQRKGKAAASPAALSRQAKRTAAGRSKRARSAQAKRAAKTRRRM
jgi:hypothetical protein